MGLEPFKVPAHCILQHAYCDVICHIQKINTHKEQKIIDKNDSCAEASSSHADLFTEFCADQ